MQKETKRLIIAILGIIPLFILGYVGIMWVIEGLLEVSEIGEEFYKSGSVLFLVWIEEFFELIGGYYT